MSVSGSISGTRLEVLRALRDTLAREIDAGPQGDKAVSQTAALARQLRDTLKEIEELEKSEPKGSIVDDLAKRRTSRRPSAKGSGKAAGDSR